MLRLWTIPAMLAIALGSLTGCTPQQAQTLNPTVRPDRSVPAAALPRILNMDVSRSSRASLSMGDGWNRLLIMAPPNGAALLNGQEIARRDEVRYQGRRLVLAPALVERIRTRMRQAPARPTAQRTRRPAEDPPAAVGRGLILIDPGHGGSDPGAVSPFGGWQEKQINLDISLHLAAQLRRRGFEVQLTRSDDRFLELDERVEIANAVEPDLLVSIHANACADPSVQGFEVYAARQASQASVSAADRVARTLESTGYYSRGVKRADFRVIARTNCPAVLIEAGFMTNRVEMTRLADAAHRRQLAEAVARGVAAAVTSR